MIKSNTVFDILSQLRINYYKLTASKNSANKTPFRSELYSSDQLCKHAIVLAHSHKLQKGRSKDKLIKRLEDNEHALLEVRNLLVETIKTSKSVTPAAEWLLDNFYLIEEQIVTARKHLPKKYSENLP